MTRTDNCSARYFRKYSTDIENHIKNFSWLALSFESVIFTLFRKAYTLHGSVYFWKFVEFLFSNKKAFGFGFSARKRWEKRTAKGSKQPAI